MRSLKTSCAILSVVALWFAGCVDYRPVRNGLADESVYLNKSELTQPDAQNGDDAWLFKVTVVKASTPNVVGAYAFPGLESDAKVVKFRFREDSMQMLDGYRMQPEDPENANDDQPTRTDRVILEFKGKHVDTKLRESLDGERTNFLEENTELKWAERQKFKVDFESTNVDPVAGIAWYYGDFIQDCAKVLSRNLIPDSVERTYDGKDQKDLRYLSFVLEVNYNLNVFTTGSPCYDMLSMVTDTSSATIHYRLSFYRPGKSSYQPQVVPEKDPVNKKYGAFQVLNVYRDPNSGLLDGRALLKRFNPDRKEPVVFYFSEGFPPKFKPMFDKIKADTNQILEEAGALLRVDFQDYNAFGIEHKIGDPRYSFIAWHQAIDTTRGLLGYGPSFADPRTGETLSATVNLYNVGLDYYRYLIQDYLAENAGLQKPAGYEDKTWEQIPWGDIRCTKGEKGQADEQGNAKTDRNATLQTRLFQEMMRAMKRTEAPSWDAFVPTPQRGWDNFLTDYLRTLPEYRYSDPGANGYVWQTAEKSAVAEFRDRMHTETEFNSAMTDILYNKSPFGVVPLYSVAGIEAQNAFSSQMRGWIDNHEKLERQKNKLFSHKCVLEFNAGDAFSAIASSARRCQDSGFWESNETYSDRLIEGMIFNVAIHEFGHNIALRHNFYGSVDAKHMHQGELSSSVMDYVKSYEEATSAPGWGDYDKAALGWIYGNQEKRTEVMQQDFLYCTDEHADSSPLCQRHDLGITPSQIVLNAIERYDWLYKIRNRRAYRKFWNTGDAIGSAYSAIFNPLRIWYMGIFDWAGGGVQDVLKRLDQADKTRRVLTPQQYDEIAQDFYRDMESAVALIISFYDAVVNQNAEFRNYQTEFDPYYGDVLRLGIIPDKLYATYAFMDLQAAFNYNPNVASYVALYDYPFATPQNNALAQKVLDDMLGANYDTFPWFKYTAVNLFAAATNTNMIDNTKLRERIAIQRFDNQLEVAEIYGPEAIKDATRSDNESQVFFHNGETYAYTYLKDRSWHLVANASRSPVSFQFIKEYNQDIRANASTTTDNYGLKILLAYYEYYNNLLGN